MTDQPKPTPRRIWNFTPALPLQLAPYWDWPLRPFASLVYLLKSWNPVGMRLMFLAAAVIVWAFFTPDISRAQTLQVDWVFEVWLRNVILLTTVAGGFICCSGVMQRKATTTAMTCAP